MTWNKIQVHILLIFYKDSAGLRYSTNPPDESKKQSKKIAVLGE